jgi:hypothetical protein
MHTDYKCTSLCPHFFVFQKTFKRAFSLCEFLFAYQLICIIYCHSMFASGNISTHFRYSFLVISVSQRHRYLSLRHIFKLSGNSEIGLPYKFKLVRFSNLPISSGKAEIEFPPFSPPIQSYSKFFKFVISSGISFKRQPET